MSTFRVLVLVTVLVTLVAACGGGGGARLGYRQFARDADGICRRASGDLLAVQVPPFSHVSAAEQALRRLVARGKTAVTKLRGLQPPRREELAVGVWLAVLDQMLAETQLAADELHRGRGLAAFSAATRADELAGRARVLARGRGIVPCRLPALVESV
jgi:hypothetical protein